MISNKWLINRITNAAYIHRPHTYWVSLYGSTCRLWDVELFSSYRSVALWKAKYQRFFIDQKVIFHELTSHYTQHPRPYRITLWGGSVFTPQCCYVYSAHLSKYTTLVWIQPSASFIMCGCRLHNNGLRHKVISCRHWCSYFFYSQVISYFIDLSLSRTHTQLMSLQFFSL